MKLTNREKLMLIVLGVVAIIFLYYNFILKPQMSEISVLKRDIQINKNKVQLVQLQLSPNNKIYTDYKRLNASITLLSDRLFSAINQEKIILILDDLLTKSKLAGDGLSFSKPKLTKIKEVEKSEDQDEASIEKLVEEFLESENQKNGSSKAKNTDKAATGDTGKDTGAEAEQMRVTVNYKGTYYDIISFMQNIELFAKKILIRSINIASSGENSLSGSLTLDFLAVPRLFASNDDSLTWNINNVYGRNNPFEPYAGYVAPNGSIAGAVNPGSNQTQPGGATAPNGQEAQYVYDFAIGVQPITADVPTVIVGKTRDGSDKSYIFADNEGYENVEIQILQSGGKYYYKYKTQNFSYPMDYGKEMIEFTPFYSDSIGLVIVSNARNGSSDKSGVNLTIINSTKLKLNVKLQDDDTQRPRVHFAKQVGDMKIYYK